MCRENLCIWQDAAGALRNIEELVPPLRNHLSERDVPALQQDAFLSALRENAYRFPAEKCTVLRDLLVGSSSSTRVRRPADVTLPLPSPSAIRN
jgi:hypothetical protein